MKKAADRRLLRRVGGARLAALQTSREPSAVPADPGLTTERQVWSAAWCAEPQTPPAAR